MTLKVTDDDGGVGTDTPTVKIMSAEEGAKEVNDYIQQLPDSALLNVASQRRAAFAHKFDALYKLIRQKQYQKAIEKLLYDIRVKTDGSLGGDPADDWIVNPNEQRIICNMIDGLVAYLRSLLNPA